MPSTLTVTTNLDDGSAGSLRSEIAAAQSGDTINFAQNVSGQTIVLTQGELAISKNLAIQGLGAGQLAISGHGSRVFEVDPGVNVTFSGLTVRDGVGDYGYGGGIFNEGNLTLNSCTVTNNSAVYDGGGIYNYYGTLTLTSCTVSNNSANTTSGIGGGILNYGGTLTITGGSITGNTAHSAGGIFNGSNCNATIDSCTVSNNTAHGGSSGNVAWGSLAQYYGAGGGLWNEGAMTITNSTFTGNVVQNSAAGGGAIYNAGSMTIKGCTITGNSTLYGGGGGGIYNDSYAYLTILKSNVTHNTSTIGASADVYDAGYLYIGSGSKVGKIYYV